MPLVPPKMLTIPIKLNSNIDFHHLPNLGSIHFLLLFILYAFYACNLHHTPIVVFYSLPQIYLTESLDPHMMLFHCLANVTLLLSQVVQPMVTIFQTINLTFQVCFGVPWT